MKIIITHGHKLKNMEGGREGEREIISLFQTFYAIVVFLLSHEICFSVETHTLTCESSIALIQPYNAQPI